jgi:hypothetical protein
MKTYKVVGSRPVFDTPPGGTFTRRLPARQERRLVASGAIEAVGEEAPAIQPVGEGEEFPEESSSQGGGLFGRKTDERQE